MPSSNRTIQNPILPGFNPDPSICRVGDDYYIATSTFEWFPGVQIHHSRDLRNWRLLTHALTRRSQLDMLGIPDSGGIWAPCLTHDGEQFHLIYTNVRTTEGVFKDTPNFLVTAKAIEGPWSEPVFLNASGFDPSLFHDDDGRKWLQNMLFDFSVKGGKRFAGIVLQEYSPTEQKLVGPITNIFDGDLGTTEGPHIYKRNGLYYLMTAEGGTGYNHAVTLARSPSIEGPYEVDPIHQFLSARKRPEFTLQKAGHGSLVETQDGTPYVAHLCSRPLGEHRRCILGRETAIQKCHWTEDGWLRVDGGDTAPLVEVPAPDLPEHTFAEESGREDFTTGKLSKHINSLRLPIDDSWASFKANPGKLRLTGRESLSSKHYQSHLARRVQHFMMEAETRFAFAPDDFQQMAGLTGYYNTDHWYFLGLTKTETRGLCLRLMSMDHGAFAELMEPIPLQACESLAIRATLDHEKLNYSYTLDGATWQAAGPTLDATILSDDYVKGNAFTGAFVGIAVQDLSGRGLHADFDYFDYRTS